MILCGILWYSLITQQPHTINIYFQKQLMNSTKTCLIPINVTRPGGLNTGVSIILVSSVFLSMLYHWVNGHLRV